MRCVPTDQQDIHLPCQSAELEEKLHFNQVEPGVAEPTQVIVEEIGSSLKNLVD